MAATTAKTGFGTLFQRETATPGTFETVTEVLSILGPETTLDLVDATHMESPDGFAEVIPAILRSGDVTFQAAYLPDDTKHQSLDTDQRAKTLKNWKIDLPGTSLNWTFAAYIKSIGQEIPFDGKMTKTVVLGLTGKATVA